MNEVRCYQHHMRPESPGPSDVLQTLSHPLLTECQLQLKTTFSWCRQGQNRANLTAVEGTPLKLVLLSRSS